MNNFNIKNHQKLDVVDVKLIAFGLAFGITINKKTNDDNIGNSIPTDVAKIIDA